MSPEANIHSIRALEKQIEEGDGDIIKLKRARNALLNISICIPPEILGCIFVWSLIWKTGYTAYLQHFDWLQKGSYNFLLVCNHWFEVATRTPELWSFWGNTLQDWKKRHHRSGATPLDLVLEEDRSAPHAFDENLQDIVRRRVTQDIIRTVHLTSTQYDTLTSIISSLTPRDEGAQNGNIESIVWHSIAYPLVDISNFFARSRLSKLRRLELCGNFLISSWDHLAPRATLLTSLSLDMIKLPQIPTITNSQLFAILISNPNLQQLRLSNSPLPSDTNGPEFQVPLRHLKLLSLGGDFRRLFGLLRRLNFPVLDSIQLNGTDSAVEVIGPYIRDYLQRGPKFQDKLKIKLFVLPLSISISVDTVWAQNTAPPQDPLDLAFGISLTNPPQGELGQFLIDLIALIPKEHVVSFGADPGIGLPEELFCMMPNIETLYLYGAELSKGFLQPDPDGPRARAKLLPSLRLLRLEDTTGDWSHLTTYLAHQTSDGQIISLEVTGYPHDMGPEVVEEIKALVEEFTFEEYLEVDSEESS